MAEVWFICQYTKHKTQKRKVFHDGYLKWIVASRKGVLFGESRTAPPLDGNFFPQRCPEELAGEEVEFDRYLVRIEDRFDPSGTSSPPPADKEVLRATAPGKKRRRGIGLRPPQGQKPETSAPQHPKAREVPAKREPPARRSTVRFAPPVQMETVSSTPSTTRSPGKLTSPLRERSQEAALAWLDALEGLPSEPGPHAKTKPNPPTTVVPPVVAEDRHDIGSTPRRDTSPRHPLVRSAGAGLPASAASLCLPPPKWLRLPEPDNASIWTPVELQTRYETSDAYVDRLAAALRQDLHARLSEAATRYWSAVRDVIPPWEAYRRQSSSRRAPPYAELPAAEPARMASLQRAARRAGAAFFASARLFFSRKKGKDGERLPRNTSVPGRWYLKLSSEDRERSQAYNRDDLWIVSTTPLFDDRDATNGVPCLDPPAPLSYQKKASNPAQRPWVWLARSVFHGPSKDGMLELRSLPWIYRGTGPPPAAMANRNRGNRGPGSLREGAPPSNAGEDSEDDADTWEAAPPARPPNGCLHVCALHAVNLSADCLMGRTLARTRMQRDSSPGGAPPLWSLLVDPATASGTSVPSLPSMVVPPGGHAMVLRNTFVTWLEEALGLNVDQVDVLRRVSRFVPLPGDNEDDSQQESESPALLVHGVFGAGKSLLLVAVIMLLSRLWNIRRRFPSDRASSPEPPPARILLASATNTAVDRVLLHLRQRGFSHFARVGSLRKIAKPLLPNVLHHSDTPDALDRAAKELRTMLHDAQARAPPAASVRQEVSSSSNLWGSDEEDDAAGSGDYVLDEADEIGSIRLALDKVERRQADHARLKQAPVVGVTCAAMGFPVLRGMEFDILLLDECSQMIEPLSVLPLCRFWCRRLLAVGDPVQLPPTLASFPTLPADRGTSGSDSSSVHESRRDLSWTLFERLAAGSVPCVMLRTQYRCHPVLAATISRLFYQGKLRHGVTPTARPALCPGLPPLAVLTYPSTSGTGGEKWVGSLASYANELEANVCARLVRDLARHGIGPERIGVISLYRAQVGCIRAQLEALARKDSAWDKSALRSLQVSTVDAFQGAERDVILVSCCRTRRGGAAAGFSDHPARMNVALSRARHHLILVGNIPALERSARWCAVLHTAKALPGGIRTVSQGPILPPPTLVPEESRSVLSPAKARKRPLSPSTDDREPKRQALGDVDSVTPTPAFADESSDFEQEREAENPHGAEDETFL